MTRIRYSYDSNTGRISTEWIPLSSSTMIKAHILSCNDGRFFYRIVDNNISMLYEGYCTSLRMAKINVRGRFKQLGVNLYDEVRKSGI